MAEAAYTAKDITVLEGLEPVRLRPGMYIGSTGSRGLHHLVFEVVDNSVDEAMAGRADLVEVTLHPDNSVTVSDNGSGIPTDVMKDQGLPAVTVVLTKLHAGGKFGGEGYKVSGGLHGVGVSVVNALSAWLHVEVKRDGKVFRQEFARGEPTTDLKKVGPTKESGTTITFLPDLEIFDELEWSSEILVQRLRETAFLTKGLRIMLIDERQGDERHEFYAEGGIRDFVGYVNDSKDPAHKHIVYLEGSTNGDSAATGPGRGRDAVEHVLRRIGLLVREQHQHPRGRLAPLRVQGRAHTHAERLRAQERHPQGEGRQPRGRGRPRGARGRDLGQAPGPAIRRADEDEARKRLGAGPRRADGQRQARRVPRGERDRGEADPPEGARRAKREAGRPQGPRADAAEERARQHVAAGQARRLLDQRSQLGRAVPRRGELGRRLRDRREATGRSRRSCRCAAR